LPLEAVVQLVVQPPPVEVLAGAQNASQPARNGITTQISPAHLANFITAPQSVPKHARSGFWFRDYRQSNAIGQG
jgi:hypothetical protein